MLSFKYIHIKYIYIFTFTFIGQLCCLTRLSSLSEYTSKRGETRVCPTRQLVCIILSSPSPTASQISVLSILDADDVAAETDIISLRAKKRNIFKLRNEVWDREPVLVCLLCLILMKHNKCFYCKKNMPNTM